MLRNGNDSSSSTFKKIFASLSTATVVSFGAKIFQDSNCKSLAPVATVLNEGSEAANVIKHILGDLSLDAMNTLVRDSINTVKDPLYDICTSNATVSSIALGLAAGLAAYQAFGFFFPTERPSRENNATTASATAPTHSHSL